MLRRLATIFFLLVMFSNLLSAWPPHPPGAGGCDAECCAIAHQTGPEATRAGLCCMLDCPPPVELPARSIALALAPKQWPGANAAVLAAPISINYLQHTRFPSAPTRALNGSASRYLETGALLI